ncbi:MAG: hypothetical protein U5L01_07350 [Rheinheimera sp.]|nr:hypothetical protein [Rheinheimera sp.]
MVYKKYGWRTEQLQQRLGAEYSCEAVRPSLEDVFVANTEQFMLDLGRIYAIFRKELWQLSRDRITFAMIVMIPLVQLVLFGYAINTDVRHVPAAIVDQSGSSAARLLAADLQASQTVRFVEQEFHDVATATKAMTVQARCKCNSRDPCRDFERRLDDRLRGSGRPLAQWITDGSDPMLGNAINSLKQMPLTLRSPSHKDSSLPASAVFEVVNYYNPERRSAAST